MNQIRYEPDEHCPPHLAALSALQIFLPNTISIIMLVTLVVRAAGQSDGYLGWSIFTGLIVSGLGMILQALRFRYVGLGRLVVTNFNVPFLSVCALALHAGGPSLLASLLVASTLLVFVLTIRLAYLRRVFTPTVSGVVVMLVAVSAVPFIVNSTVVPPEDANVAVFLAPGMAALAVAVAISLQGSAIWRLWILPITVASGLVVALPLGLYDFRGVVEAPWVSLPASGWPGLDLAFGREFWGLLPVFVIVNLTAFIKTVGDLPVIYRAAHRNPATLDFRAIQGGLNVYGVSTLLCGLAGTLPVAAPWAVTVVYVGFTGVASRIVGVYLGLITIAIVPFSKLLAVLVAIPSPVVSAVYVIIFGLLFIEGAKTAFADRIDQKKATITGVSMVLGLSAGSFGGLLGGVTSMLVSSAIVVGSISAIGMTLLTEMPKLRNRRLRIELDQSALPAVDDFLSRFAERYSWEDDAKNRLRLVGEEVVVNLLAEDGAEAPAGNGGSPRRLTANIHPDGSSAEMEFVVVSHDAVAGNLEDQLAYLSEDFAPESDEQHLSVQILRHYTSSVNHRKYYGMDIITCRVDK